MSLKIKIIELRNEGKSYKEIQNILNCSKGTICYYCGNGQKEKASIRLRKNRNKEHPFKRKIEHFSSAIKSDKKNKNTHKIKKLIQLKIETFFKDRKNNMKYRTPTFTVDDVINKFGENPVCSLTGQSIDINNPRTYQFDHKLPVSRGGDNSLDNLQILTKAANQAKSDLTNDEFIELCKTILVNQGYQVTKIDNQ